RLVEWRSCTMRLFGIARRMLWPLGVLLLLHFSQGADSSVGSLKEHGKGAESQLSGTATLSGEADNLVAKMKNAAVTTLIEPTKMDYTNDINKLIEMGRHLDLLELEKTLEKRHGNAGDDPNLIADHYDQMSCSHRRHKISAEIHPLLVDTVEVANQVANGLGGGAMSWSGGGGGALLTLPTKVKKDDRYLKEWVEDRHQQLARLRR
ncbi:hypothetical protein PSACC_02678, partial [Paramicrosporidium saccamoebae]